MCPTRVNIVISMGKYHFICRRRPHNVPRRSPHPIAFGNQTQAVIAAQPN